MSECFSEWICSASLVLNWNGVETVSKMEKQSAEHKTRQFSKFYEMIWNVRILASGIISFFAKVPTPVLIWNVRILDYLHQFFFFLFFFFHHLKSSGNCRALCSEDFFSILDTASIPFNFKIKEAMHINSENPH